MTAPQLVAL